MMNSATLLPWLISFAILAAAALAAVALHATVFAVARRISSRTETKIDESLVRRSHHPGRLLFVLVALLLAAPLSGLEAGATDMLQQTLVLGLTAAVGWLGISVTGTLTDFVVEAYRVDVADNLRARQIHTQIIVIRRIIITMILVIVVCLMLMSFPQAREIGLSLFASAGIAGLILGMAARPALSNLIAGIQLAFTGPINIDDVVIVEGEWGRIEEIGGTYVVIRIWDQRRLIVPLSYFIENPYQNWTRRTADILGTVTLHADYRVPVDAVRQELHRILLASGLWDGNVWNLQVTEAGERTVQLRALMSAPDAGRAWDLRCHVRESLVHYLQETHPEALPRVRAEVDPS